MHSVQFYIYGPSTYAGQTDKEGQELEATASISPREGSALLCVTGNASHLQQQLASYSFHVAIAS
jgi:hypothetical protein